MFIYKLYVLILIIYILNNKNTYEKFITNYTISNKERIKYYMKKYYNTKHIVKISKDIQNNKTDFNN